MPANEPLRRHLLTRRSVGIGFLREPGPSEAELREMLTMAVRVPDHGKFAPWRLVLFEGDARAKAGEAVADIARRNRPELDDAGIAIERRQFLPAPLTVGVIFSPRPNPKAPELEQLLSAGAVCLNLVHAAYAFGYAASWVTRWFAFDPAAQAALGARGGERFVGFVHIGTPTMVPEDRDRPDVERLVTRWQG